LTKKPDHRNTRPYGNSDEIVHDPYWGAVWHRDLPNNIPVPELEGRYCDSPFNWIEISADGRTWLCCPTWLPYSVGNVFENTISEIWNSKKVQQIRQTIYNGSYNYCQKTICPKIQNGSLPKLDPQQPQWVEDPTGFPENINFSTDESCNLYCPSCRIKKILHGDGPLYLARKSLDDRIWDEVLAQPKSKKINIHITGSGDPFGSKVFRERLLSLDCTDRPNMYFYFKTNGVMLTPKMWDSLSRIHNNIKNINISIDSARPETYDKIRAGGNWNTLMSNLQYLDPISAERGIEIYYDYVVQKSNHREMLEFCELVSKTAPNYKHIQFTLVSDWGTWPKEQYEKQAIWKDNHPDHAAWLEYLADPRFNNYRINWMNVNQYRRRAVEQYGNKY